MFWQRDFYWRRDPLVNFPERMAYYVCFASLKCHTQISAHSARTAHTHKRKQFWKTVSKSNSTKWKEEEKIRWRVIEIESHGLRFDFISAARSSLDRWIQLFSNHCAHTHGHGLQNIERCLCCLRHIIIIIIIIVCERERGCWRAPAEKSNKNMISV